VAVYECGKQWREADADVAESIDYCVTTPGNASAGQPLRRDVPGEENTHFYEPRASPCHRPLEFPSGHLVRHDSAALVTGNTVVMKPAEQSSVIAAKLMEVFQEIGFAAA